MERYSALLGHARPRASHAAVQVTAASTHAAVQTTVASASTTASRPPAASSDAAAASAETSLLAKQLAMADRARAAEHEQVLRLERMAEAARAQEAELAGRLRHAETQVAEALHDRARFDVAREEVERQLEAARAALEAARWSAGGEMARPSTRTW